MLNRPPCSEPHVCKLWLLMACLVFPGCYAYRQIEPAAVRPNEQIRVIVTNDAALRVSAQFGVPAPLEGEFASLSPDSLAVAVWVGRGFGGTDFASARQTIPLTRAEVVTVEQRKFSAKRTTLATLGMVAATAILINRLGIIELPWLETSDPPTPPEPGEPVRALRRSPLRN